jgi:hypothetical protein
MTEVQPPPKPHRSGFLWGCLTPIIIVGLLIVGGIGYVAYYMTNGYKNDPSVQSVLASVQSNPTARVVLGDNIVIVGTPGYSWAYNNGVHTATYTLTVKGSLAQGTANAAVTIVNTQTHINILTLTGPDGKTYNLIGTGPVPPSTSSDSASLWRNRLAAPA